MAPTAEMTEKPTRTVVFLSLKKALTIVRKRETYRYADGSGEKIPVPGIRYDFVPAVGPEGKVYGKFETSDPEVIEWLRSYKKFGHPELGYFELPPNVPEPVEELRALALAGIRADAEAVQAILDAERDGWEREIVIEACETALATIREIAAGQPPAVDPDTEAANEAKVAAQPTQPAEPVAPGLEAVHTQLGVPYDQEHDQA